MLRRSLKTWLAPLLLVSLSLMSLWIIGSLSDWILQATGHLHNPIFDAILPTSHEEARSTFGSLLEFMAGLVGLGLTVATILVQLSATRYSSRVIDLFMTDWANILYFTLAIVTPLYAFWVMNLLTSLPIPSTHPFLVLILISLNMLLLIPYVNHLFENLKPEAIIGRIRSSIDPTRLRTHHSDDDIRRMGNNLVTSVNQLTDVVLNSVTNSDINLALRTVVALRDVICDTLQYKGHAPKSWFTPPPDTFLGPAAQQLTRMKDRSAWAEVHTLKQFELIFVQCLGRYQELTSAIVSRTQEIARVAIDVRDHEVVELITLFFNTFLRHALNANDVRTIFHTFYQYRLIGEHCLESGQHGLLTKMAFYFKYYGQQGEKKGIGFAIEIAASDLRVLIEKAWEWKSPVTPELVAIFLEVDREAEEKDHEMGQRGVRKSQAILAAFFLSKGEEHLARQIFDDMSEERLERMRSIKEELNAGTSQDFWEIQERGSNFYHIPPELVPHLDAFFSWFYRPSISNNLG